MSDNEYNKRVNERMQQEFAELEDRRVQYQQMLDRWVESQRQLAADEARFRRNLDPYNYGHWR